MKISSSSKSKLTDIILMRPYRKGKILVDLFNDFSEKKDTYDSRFPSRSDYTKSKIDEFNGTEKLRFLIEEVFHISHFEMVLDKLNDVINDFNIFLSKDGYVIEITPTSRGVCGKIKCIEHGLIDVKNAPVSHEFINEQIRKCREKLFLLKPDIDGAITNARSLAESVMKFVLEELGKELPDYKGNIVDLYKEIRKQLTLDPHKDLEDTLKQVFSGLSSIVSGLGGLSNKSSDRHAREYKPSLSYAKLAVNTSFTLCDFLLNVLEEKNLKS